MDGAQPLAPKGRRRSLNERLDAARLKETEAAAKLIRRNREVQKYQALQKTRERKLDTRRKIIAGGLALKHARMDPAFGNTFRALLDRFVETEPERLLFGLPPLPLAPDGASGPEQQASTVSSTDPGGPSKLLNNQTQQGET